MAALTETSSVVTEFAGKYKMACVEVNLSATTGTTGTVTIDEMTAVIGAVATLKGPGTADCAYIHCSVATNVVTLIPMEDDGTTLGVQNPVDCYLIAVGY